MEQQEEQKVFDEVIGYTTKHDGFFTSFSIISHLYEKSQPFGLTFSTD
ncbi:MAG: hypothetical protein LUI06_02075 [Ruminococcus sp.]|nr:hypothetical protein [Ruminococcus sp.]